MERFRSFQGAGLFGAVAVALCVLVLGGLIFQFYICRFEVDTGQMAVLIKKTGKDLPVSEEIAPSEEYKGVQREVLGEGRHYRNPWTWRRLVVPQIEIPEGKLGVRTRLYGDEPPEGEIIAWKENEKGIVPDVLRPGRYPINAWIVGTERRAEDSYAEHIELVEPVRIPAGFKGVETLLSGPLPAKANSLMSEPGERGVQTKALDEGTYYINPYVKRIDLVDCRSKRFDLSHGDEMGFPSKDGFWITLDGVIEFRVKPEESAKVFVLLNDHDNDDASGARVDEEIINKVIMPNARAFCRIEGSNYSGREFISGETRIEFQHAFQTALEQTCESQGIEIVVVSITDYQPPQKIREVVMKREIALQDLAKYQKQKLQQESEKELAVEKAMIERKKELVAAEQEVVKVTTDAERKQEVAVIEANQRLKVAELQMQAAEDMAAKTLRLGEADAKVIEFDNAAEAAGWRKSVAAFDGDGKQLAQYILFTKMAPAFQRMMVNTADSPLMKVFDRFGEIREAVEQAAEQQRLTAEKR
jgi:hypothetical protein